jgi:hypothetical protein
MYWKSSSSQCIRTGLIQLQHYVSGSKRKEILESKGKRKEGRVWAKRKEVKGGTLNLAQEKRKGEKGKNNLEG